MKQHQYKIALVLCVIMAMMMVTRVISPCVTLIKERFEEQISRHMAISEASDAEARIIDLQRQNRSLLKSMKRLKLSVPREKRLSAIIDLINQAADSSKVQVTNILTFDEISYKKHIEMPFEISVVGTYHQAGLFTNLMESAGHVVKFRGIYLKSEKIHENRITGKLNISLYVLK